MKKLLSCLLAGALAVEGIGFGAAAAETGSIRVESASVKAGDTFELPVIMEENPGIAALSLQLSYDAEKLTLLDVQDGNILGSSAFTPGKDLTLMPYTINWDDLGEENNTGTGTLAVLSFAVKETAPDGFTDVAVEINSASTVNADLEEVEFLTTRGSVRIGDSDIPQDAPVGLITVSSPIISVGDTFEVPVELNVNPGLRNLKLDVSFDTDKLEYVDADNNRLFPSSESQFRHETNSPEIHLQWFSPEGVTQTAVGFLCTLTFKAKDDFAGTTEITAAVDMLGTYTADWEKVYFDVISGTVTAVGEVPSKEPAIAVDTGYAQTGETVVIPVDLVNNPGITALSLNLTYDPSLLRLIEAEDTGLLGNSAFTPGNDLTLIPYTMNWDDLTEENNTGSGTVVNLYFEVLAESGEASVDVEINQPSTFNVDMEEVAFAPGSGKVIVYDEKLTTEPPETTAIEYTTTPEPGGTMTTVKPKTTAPAEGTTTKATAQTTTTKATAQTTTTKATAQTTTTKATAQTTTTKATAQTTTTKATAQTTTTKATAQTTTTKATAQTTTTKATAQTTTLIKATTATTVNGLTTAPEKSTTTKANAKTTSPADATTTAAGKTTTLIKETTATIVKDQTTAPEENTTTKTDAATTASDESAAGGTTTHTTAPLIKVTTAPPKTTFPSDGTTSPANTTTTEPVTTKASGSEPLSDGGIIFVNYVTAKKGEIAEVPIHMQDNPGIIALSLNISYDSSQLRLVGAEDGKILGKSVFQAGHDLSLIPYTLNWDDLGTVNNTGDGILATLKFEVLISEGTAEIEIAVNQSSTFNLDLEEVQFAASKGGVFGREADSSGGLKGDINADGNIDLLDAMAALSEYVYNMTGAPSTLTDAEKQRGDIDENDIIDLMDAMAILKYYTIGITGKTPDWSEILASMGG